MLVTFFTTRQSRVLNIVRKNLTRRAQLQDKKGKSLIQYFEANVSK